MTLKNSVLLALILVATAACGGGSSTTTNPVAPIVNSAPLVNAGLDATVRLPDTLALDGTVTDDGLPSGGTLSTSWMVSSGPAGATFADVNAVDTVVTFVSEGTYVLELTANDSALQSSDTVTITVEAAPALTAIAITPDTAALASGATQLFVATGTDQYGDAIAVSPTWTATGGTIDASGTYTAGAVAGSFTVTATDGSVSNSATVTISSSPPTANAGGPYVGVEGSPVALDGSGSTDANNDITDYDWDLDNDGAYDDATGTNPTFTPPSSGVFTIGLRVTDADGASNVDSTTVTISNLAPTANAGPDQPSVDEGATVILDGSGSSDPGGDPLTYAWTLTSIPAGSAAVLSDAAAVNPTFVTDLKGSYVAELVVNDGTVDSAADTVTITVGNAAPTANAGPDQAGIVQGATVTLDGSGSSDPGGDTLTYAWTLTTLPAGSSAVLSDATAVSPTFDADLVGSYVVELVVNDGTIDSAADTVTITVDNAAPTANAGPDQAGIVQGATVTLDGSGSSDPGGDTLTYAWTLTTLPAGSAAVLSDATAASPTFDTDAPGSYVAELVVNDGTEDSAADTVTITVDNAAPTANAGPDQAGVAQGATVTLDGSGSSDPGGDTLTYAWTLTTIPAGSAAVLSDASAVSPTFDTDLVGSYIAELVVNDGTVDSAADTVTITVDNAAPTANAGPDQAGVAQGATVALDGSGSSDPGGDTLTYAWTLTTIPAGSSAVLSDATAVSPTFDTDLPGSYVAELVVNDGTTDSAADTVTITVDNTPPVAVAGPDQSGIVQGATVTLDGSGSSDPGGDTLTYAWTLTTIPAGSAAVLSDATAVSPTFDSDAPGSYVAELVVNDGTADSPADTVTITVDNIAPTANAGPDQTALVEGASVILDGSGSSDPGGDTLTYAWTLTTIPAGSAAVLSDATAVNPSFTADQPGSYVAELVVNDGTTDSAADTVTITVANAAVVAYWRFDEGAGSATADAVGGSDGTLVGTAWGAGVSGTAVSFNGTSDYVSIDNTAALNITGSTITLSAWINPAKGDEPSGSRIISKRTDGAGQDVYAMLIADYRLRFRLDGVDMVGPIVRLNDWTHVVMVYDGVDKRIYINGALDPTTPQAKTDPINASSRAVQLGWREGDADRYYEGLIDEVQIYDRALNSTEVAALYAGNVAPPTPAGLYFSDITLTAGTSGLTNDGNGLQFAEVDNDSLPDLYVNNNRGGFTRSELFYDNVDGNVFSEEAAARGIDDFDGGSLGSVWADLDNDGDYDLFNGARFTQANPIPGFPEHNNVYENDGSGVFTDVTGGDVLATLRETGDVTAFDWDGDGDLDLFGASAALPAEPNEAFRNDGGFTFTSFLGGGDLTTTVANEGIVIDTDYDGDGDIDILGGTRAGDLVILQNDGSGLFAQIDPVSIGISIATPAQDGVTPGDIDNDGDLDLLMVSFNTGYLYRREAGGSYVLARIFFDVDGFMGGLADLDNDGDLDIAFAGDGFIYKNDGTGVFEKDQSVPVSELADPRSIAFADIEGDGDLDFAITGKASRNYLIRNDIDAAAGNWLKVELGFGLGSSQCQAGAFGAKTRVYAAGDLDGTLLGLRESRGSHGSRTQDDPVLHFGLGTVDFVDIRVTFVDGSTTTRLNEPTNQRIVIQQCP